VTAAQVPPTLDGTMMRPEFLTLRWLRLFEEQAQQELAEAIQSGDPDAERRARERWISASAYLFTAENAKQEQPYAIN